MSEPEYIATDSTRLSIERILKFGADHPQFENDAKKVAMALRPFLDRIPTAPQWLHDIGITDDDFESHFKDLFTVPATHKEGEPVPKLATRGAVRALCAVLRIPIREGGEA